MIILLTVGVIKKILLYKMSYFLEQHTKTAKTNITKTQQKQIEVQLDLANYATKSD